MNQAFEESLIKNLERIEIDELKTFLKRFFSEKNLLYNAFDAILYGICILDQDNRLIAYNKFSKFFFHRNIPQPKGINILELSRHKDLQMTLEKMLISNRFSEYTEINIFDEVSRDIVVSLYSYTPYQNCQAKENNTRNFFYKALVLNDITDWKNKKLEEDQKKSINSLQTLTAGIAHEIKNPLAAMDLHIQLIKRFTKNHQIESKEKLTGLLDVVSEEVIRLEAIVNDFLYSFRPMKAQKSPYLLNEIIIEVVDLLKVKCQENKIRLKLFLDKGVESFLFDKYQMKQVLINLIQNSIEAIQENHNLEEFGIIEIITKEEKEKIKLILSDNGIGVAVKNFTEIFKPFHTSKKMGTGLGLSIVTKIIQEHNGEIILNPDYKFGTQFILEFSRLPTFHKIKLLPSNLKNQ